MLRHNNILLGNTINLIWIHQNYYWYTTIVDHNVMYPREHCTQQIYILWNLEGNLQYPTCDIPRQSETSQKIGTQRVLTMQTQTRPMEAQVEPYHIFIGGWCLRGQIYWQKKYRPLDKWHTRALSSINILGSTTILCHEHQMEFSKTGGWFIHARLYPSGTSQVPTHSTNKKRAFTT